MSKNEKPKKADDQITRTKKAFKKIKKIEIELADGEFKNLEYFLRWSGKQAWNYALEWAAFYGRLDLVKKVIATGADPNASSCASLQMACRNGHLEIVKYLVESGMFNNLPGINVLLEVVENRHLVIAEYLLSNDNIFGTNLCDVHCDYDCALRVAVQMNYVEMVALLIKYGADVNVFDGYLLDHATKFGYSEIAGLLSH